MDLGVCFDAQIGWRHVLVLAALDSVRAEESVWEAEDARAVAADAAGDSLIVWRADRTRSKGDTMPRGDGMGPDGMGPMTGRAAGYCAGYATPGFATPGPGRGMGYGFRFGGRGYGRGRGMGRGWGGGYGGYAPMRWPYPASPASGWAAPEPMDAETELTALRNQAEQMGELLSRIETRIQELEKTDSV